MILVKGATNLLERLAQLPMPPDVGLLLSRKPKPSSFLINTTSKKI
jgi:hypothetical protein